MPRQLTAVLAVEVLYDLETMISQVPLSPLKAAARKVELGAMEVTETISSAVY
jgi:hypothetical protein